MAETLTAQQLQAVTNHGGTLLVSAAAGSGKTKVLVERILRYLKDPVNPANLDDFLIITYTKAAASELRGKIASKLSQEIAENPDNRHLQQQLQRLYLTKISTVHSFCADILREYAFYMDIPVDFRVAEENECLELQYTVIDQLLNNVYENDNYDPDFYAFVDSQGFGRNDRQLPDIILKLYNSARCHMDSEGWLDWCLQSFEVTSVQDASDLEWAKYLIEDLHYFLDMHISAMARCAEDASGADGMQKPVTLFHETIDQLRALRACDKWDDIIAHSRINFGTLRFSAKNVDAEMASHMKAVREACKKGLAKKLRRFTDSSEQVISNITETAAAARGMIAVTRQFISAYDKVKRHKRILDFGDLEHKTLDLLLGKRRYGPTAIAAEISSRFREVLVDEYQDSNQVQDAIFSAITAERQNFFMVGDVKQSIYQFRLADPGIFLEKYNRYVPADIAEQRQGRKVLLSKNFRSSKGVIDAVNDVFVACMSERVGSLNYGVDEMLYEGVPHVSLEEPEVELYGIQTKESAYEEDAAFVAERIAQLLDGTHMVRENNVLRPICPDDIAILLRSPGSVGWYYADALENKGVLCCTGNTENLMEAEEIETLRALLQVIDNPLQDIPLITVLTSKVFCFTADDLASFRSGKKYCRIYTSLQASLSEKSQAFVSTLELLRGEAKSNSLARLLKRIFAITGFDSIYASLPDGEARIENLQSFCKIAADYESTGLKSLNRFLKHLEALEEKGLPGSGAERVNGAVTIMSIHKSKGLEFPVVFLPALSRSFNMESTYAQLLCDKDLGLGLNCVDSGNRIRYPSVAKRAIATKMAAEDVSEEMRILYVAMTRARDRLIMTYASKSIEADLADIALRMDYASSEMIAGEANCPGKWILYTAMQRTEAGAFFAVSSKPTETISADNPWIIRLICNWDESAALSAEEDLQTTDLPDSVVKKMGQLLRYEYPYLSATTTPSKQTATQLKGRVKDIEAAENTQHRIYHSTYRKPSFMDASSTSMHRGTAMHAVMQYLRYEVCVDAAHVEEEVARLEREGYISADQAAVTDMEKIAQFFRTEVGRTLMYTKNVLREFKFSVLDDASKYDPAVKGEEILLQGVVDCAILEPDGITVIDFKTDRVTPDTLSSVAEGYRMQVTAYADAMQRIYQKPVKEVMLYFFEMNEFVRM